MAKKPSEKPEETAAETPVETPVAETETTTETEALNDSELSRRSDLLRRSETPIRGEVEGGPVPLPDVIKTIDAWQAKYRLASWRFAALTQHKKWKSGKTVTQAEFEAALSELDRQLIGG
jgi:hypothetical protein